MDRIENQTLALAGMFQAAVLIEELANLGSCNDGALDGSFNSLFTFDADSPSEVFGDIGCLNTGFAALDDYLGGQARGASGNIAYYVVSMMKLARVLMNNDGLANRLAAGLSDIRKRGTEFEMSRAGMFSRIDGLYQQSVSNLEPRIMVRGDQNHLQNGDNAARIRTLLLAGIRAAVLWRQLGGSKWRLFLSRRKYVAAARKLARQASQPG